MTPREQLTAIFHAGIDAVSPHAALLRHLKISGNKLLAANEEFPLNRVIVAGAGKGAAPMALALEELLGPHLEKGFAVVKYGHGLPLKRFEINEAAHPEPDAAGERAARRCLGLAKECGPGDLFIVLLTGGASALLPLPAPGISLEDLRATTSALLACGANIGELNTVRKHLSAISGGRLAEAAYPANVLGVIVSDVIGDDLSVIASGPTSPDSSTFADCLAIIGKYHLEEKLPAAVFAFLKEGVAGGHPETPGPEAPCFSKTVNIVVANNGEAVAAAAAKARELGFMPVIVESPMQGEARDMARNLCDRALAMAASMLPGDQSLCILAGGETTVTIRGNGKGGRNQEMALAATLELAGNDRVTALFAGTDGTDGPTDAAGGFAPANLDVAEARKFLDNNDSYSALEKHDDLLITGPTRSNVMDLAIILVEPPAAAPVGKA